MSDSRTERFVAKARAGKLSRRAVLETGLRLGVATPLLTSLALSAPEAKAAPRAAAAPVRQDGASSGTFTNIITSGAEDVDPHYSYSTLSSTVAMAVYDMLVQYKDDSTTEIAPMLAESWEANEDQSVVTFKLKPDVLFHDGTVCDAQAVKDSYTRWIELGGSPVNVITRFVESPDQMEAVDATTLRFNLGKPQPLFVYAMASQYGPSVLSPTAIAENATEDDPYAHEFFKASGVGTGPYRLVSNTLNEGFVFEKFEEYHGGWEGNHFDRIVFRVVPEEATRRQLLEQGEGDAAAFNLTVDNIEALRQVDRVKVVEYPSTANQWAILNVPRLQTVEARQGLSYAFPYDDVQNVVFKGLLKRSGPLADSVRGYDPDVFLYETDLDKAKELLLQGGFQEGDVFEYMLDANDPREVTIGQLFQANVQQMGFALELLAVDYTTLEATIFGDAPPEEKPHVMGGWGWWPDYNDAWNQLAPNFTAANIGGGGSNGGAWENARFEEIMAEAENYTDEARYDELMKEAQNILTEQDPPAIYYGQIIYYTVIGSDIQGYVPNPLYLSSFNFWNLSRAAST